MTIEDEIFKRYTIDLKKLIQYGFKENNGEFLFEKLFKNNEFRAEVTVLKSGKISGKVYEVETNEEFLPLRYFPLENQYGAFVSEIRDNYSQILYDIREHCFSKNYFVSNQANRITNMIISKYGNEPVFMWEQDASGVFKNPDNNKWYGIIMDINYSKLGENNKNFVEVINLKLDKEEIQTLLKRKGFYPAWHMNKKYWITVTLDETLSDNEILELVDESHSYTVKY